MQIPSPNISKPCKTLEDELHHVKLEIVKLMSDNEHEVVDKQKLDKYETKISELEEKIAQFKELKENEDTNELLENNK